MTVVSLLAIYFVVWWIVLFAVLPFGIRTQHEDGAVTLGTAESAPSRPRLARVAIITSIVAAAIVAALWVAVDVYGFNLEVLSSWFDFRR
jgi:predicted secreted protein